MYTTGCLAAIAAIAAIALIPATAAAGGATLKAYPTNVMVNTDTTLSGGGFPAHTTLKLRECGARFWLAPKDSCDTENARTVETNSRGRFKLSFKVQLCPEGEVSGPTQRTCYIGVLKFGEDTGSLEPAARVLVSYP
jgi:hypothetical protein